MTHVPTLETERLLLRGFESRDFDVYAEMMADPAVTRFLADGTPLERADAWRQLAMIAGHWALRGFGVWACLLYTSPSPRDLSTSRMPSSA